MSPRLLSLSILAFGAACAGATGASREVATSPQVQARSEPSHRHGARDQDAPRRSAAEPIEIVVCGAAIPEELSGALDARRAVEAIARELWDEPLFRVRAVHAAETPVGIEGCMKEASRHGFVPDVLVLATAERDDAVSRIRRTGNLEATPTLTVRVEAASVRGAGRSAPSASGPVSAALAVVVDAARAAREAILEELAPDLPSHEIASRGGERSVCSAGTATTLRRLLAQR